MKLIFATFFDINYLSRGLILIKSLQNYHSNFTIYLLCLDSETKNYFLKNKVEFSQVVTIELSELESWFPELVSCKTNRSKIEYYFTLSPILPLYILEKYHHYAVCSLDADIKFYASPEEIFKDLEKYSIIVTPHKFSEINKDLIKFGKNNVSFQIFKNDEIGLKCLQKWKKQCIDWCHDYLDEENNRFADQKYLDTWENDYPDKVKTLNSSTTGIAPWNLNNYSITKKFNSFNSNGEKIIFFHFHHFKLIGENWATNGFEIYKVKTGNEARSLYFDYWKRLKKINKELAITTVNIRTNSDVSKRQKLRTENSLFLNLFFNSYLSIRFNKLPIILQKIIFKIYA
mgnify:CR=1 FL=1|jgi:hypothetical protein